MTKKMKAARLVPLLFAIPAASLFPLSSCGLTQPWDFDRSTKHGTEINYCLLIGQNDHSDSIERTRSTRAALNTLDTSEATKTRTKDNPNIAEPIQGHITFDNPIDPTKKHTFVVNEIEHMEQKSMAGNPWDSITANNNASTWIAKHGHNITFFVSNNDAMAEGAMWASNWIKGMPIFGYDANATTLQWVNAGNITGTVDQNASIQASAAMMILRNMLEDRDEYWTEPYGVKGNGFGSPTYNPTYRGFVFPNSKNDEEEEKYKYGRVNGSLLSPIVFDYKEKGSKEENRQILSLSTAIAKIQGGGQDYLYNNIGQYMKKDGSAKEPKDMFDQFTQVNDITKQTSVHYEICQTYCNKAEAFLMSTLKPYFREYGKRLRINIDEIEGDGNGEELVINQVRSRSDKYDAFLINMSKTTSTLQYVLDLAKKAYNYENAKVGPIKRKVFKDWGWNDDPNWAGWDKWEERLDTPLIFFNRQPHTDDGELDYDIMNNHFFKYTYFVGVDAKAGGDVQGKLIQYAIQTWYEKWAKQNI